MLKLRSLAAAGATVLLIHHVGKGETAQKYRGSSYFLGGLDAAWTVKNSAGAKKLDILYLDPFKSRLTISKEYAFRYVHEKGFESLGKRNPGQNDMDVVAELLKANPGVSGRELKALAKARNISDRCVQNFIDTHLNLGTISTKSGPHRAMLLYWGKMAESSPEQNSELF